MMIDLNSLKRKLRNAEKLKSIKVFRNILRIASSPWKLPTVLSIEEVDLLLNTLNTDSPLETRNKAIHEMVTSLAKF